MDAVVLGWDPDGGNLWSAPYEDCIRRCREESGLIDRSPVGAWNLAHVGARAHLMLLGPQRGLVGRGTVRSAAFLSADPRAPGQVTHHVLVEWDTLLPLDMRIPVEVLEAAVPQLPWRSSYAPAMALPPEAARQVDLIWAANAARPARRRTHGALRFLRR
jgi:hypothetical protein